MPDDDRTYMELRVFPTFHEAWPSVDAHRCPACSGAIRILADEPTTRRAPDGHVVTFGRIVTYACANPDCSTRDKLSDALPPAARGEDA